MKVLGKLVEASVRSSGRSPNREDTPVDPSEQDAWAFIALSVMLVRLGGEVDIPSEEYSAIEGTILEFEMRRGVLSVRMKLLEDLAPEEVNEIDTLLTTLNEATERSLRMAPTLMEADA